MYGNRLLDPVNDLGWWKVPEKENFEVFVLFHVFFQELKYLDRGSCNKTEGVLVSLV